MELVETLKNRLNDGVVNFTFIKKDGSERNARGTTNADIVAENNATPKGTGYDMPTSVTRYYDLNSNGWRSFNNDNLVSIDD